MRTRGIGRPVDLLLIEDNPHDAELIRRMLGRAVAGGCSIRVAVTLASGLASAKDVSTDVVLLDLGLPDSAGLHTFVRAHAEVPDKPIIVLSGLDDEEVAYKSVQGGAQDYLIKGQVDGPTLWRSITCAIERKQAAAALRASEEKLRLMFESISDAICVCGSDQRISQVNEAAVRAFGYSGKEDLAGQYALDLIAPRDRARARNDFCRMLIDGQIKTAFYAGVKKDGSEFPMELSGALLRVVDNSAGFICITKDITERRRMEEQLYITDRLASIGELSSGIAHELNNPLTSVIGLSRLLLEKDLPAEVKDDLTLVCSEAERAAQVVKHLLAFARKHPALKQMVNINQVIDKILKIRAYEQKVNNVRVVTGYDPYLPVTAADFFQLQQVFLNIIINAEFFMVQAHNRGLLTITTERQGDMIRVIFADDGPGIMKEHLPHVFDPFFTTKEVGQGSGLGLSISHGLVVQHGGRLTVQSEEGHGATFTVEVPITEVEEASNE